MKKYNHLLADIAHELELAHGDNEDEIDWKARILYSVLGQMANASLYDVQEDADAPSITHFKHRILSVLSAYLAVYPELNNIFSDDHEIIAEEIYSIFLSTGQMYHTPQRLTAAMPCQTCCGDLSIVRGMPIDTVCSVSGIGRYQVCETSGTSALNEIQEMFHLHSAPLDKFWDHLINNKQWLPLENSDQIEFLRTRPPFYLSYWLNRPDFDGSVSLARTGHPEGYIYYLCKKENDVLLYSQLPEWLTMDYQYRYISNCCLASFHTLPPIIYQTDSSLATIHLNYLLPVEELNFLKLYSWPVSLTHFPDDFHRIMDIRVFNVFKSLLESVGYQFKKE